MKTLMVVAILMLAGGVVKGDVILGALAASSLCFAVAAMLAVRNPGPQPAQV